MVTLESCAVVGKRLDFGGERCSPLLGFQLDLVYLGVWFGSQIGGIPASCSSPT